MRLLISGSWVRAPRWAFNFFFLFPFCPSVSLPLPLPLDLSPSSKFPELLSSFKTLLGFKEPGLPEQLPTTSPVPPYPPKDRVTEFAAEIGEPLIPVSCLVRCPNFSGSCPSVPLYLSPSPLHPSPSPSPARLPSQTSIALSAMGPATELFPRLTFSPSAPDALLSVAAFSTTHGSPSPCGLRILPSREPGKLSMRSISSGGPSLPPSLAHSLTLPPSLPPSLRPSPL